MCSSYHGKVNQLIGSVTNLLWRPFDFPLWYLMLSNIQSNEASGNPRSGMGNWRPAGHMRPASSLCEARRSFQIKNYRFINK